MKTDPASIHVSESVHVQGVCVVQNASVHHYSISKTGKQAKGTRRRGRNEEEEVLDLEEAAEKKKKKKKILSLEEEEEEEEDLIRC